MGRTRIDGLRGTTCLELKTTKGIGGTIGRSVRATTISGGVGTSGGHVDMVDRVTRIRVHRVDGRVIGGGVTTQPMDLRLLVVGDDHTVYCRGPYELGELLPPEDPEDEANESS